LSLKTTIFLIIINLPKIYGFVFYLTF